MLDLRDVKIGDYLLTQRGEIAKVATIYEGNTYPIGTSKGTYTIIGKRYESEESRDDVIAIVPPQVMFEFYRVLNQYYTSDSFKIILDNCYKNHLEKKEK